MANEIFPRHYDAWKKCITHKCKIDLTPNYIQTRIKALSDPNSKERELFIDKYGDHWTQTVINYFKQALNQL